MRRISDLLCPSRGELWRGEDGEGDDDDHAVLSHDQLSGLMAHCLVCTVDTPGPSAIPVERRKLERAGRAGPVWELLDNNDCDQ